MIETAAYRRIPRQLAYLLGFIIAVGPVSVDIYLPAFELIAHRFGAGVPQLTLASYFAGFAIGQLTQGLLSDRFGRRLPLAVGVVVYILASLGCATATGPAMFCVCRAVAAFGAAASIVIPRAIVRDVADGTRAASLMSDVLMVMSVAPVLAPVLGSAVLTFAGWRTIFVVAALYGVIGLYLVARYIPETLPLERRATFGLLPTTRLYGRILGEREFLIHSGIGALGMAALFAYLAGAPAVFLEENHLTPGSFGLTLGALGIATIGFFRINKSLVRARSTRVAIDLGIAVWLLAGTGLCALAWTQRTSAPAVLLLLLVFLLGYSLIPSNAQVGALAHHPAHAATATSLMSSLQYGLGALAGALVGWLADGTARPMAAIILACAVGAAVITQWRPRADDCARVRV